jgi:hypothetical protein
MGYRSAADGVTQSGKTKGKNLGDSGKEIGIEGGKGKSSVSQPTSMDMKKVGRNMARANNQSKGR